MNKKAVVAGVLLMGVVSVPLLNSSVNASPEIFEQMSGKFRGKGLVKYTPKSKQEAIRCRSSNKVSKDGKRLKMIGSCAAGGWVFSINGHIDHLDGNSYGASIFRAFSSIRQSKITGKRSGTRINFSLNGVDKKTKQKLRGKINVTSKANAYVIEVISTHPPTGEVFNGGTITFSRK